MFFLPYAYMTLLSLFLLLALAFVFVFCLYFYFILFVPSVSLPGDDVLLGWLAIFLSVVFCLLSLLFSEELIPGLICFGSSVYLVTPAGFVADQLI